MPIAAYGGLVLDKDNNRVYPGSGGIVGGFTPGVANYGWLAGAGKTYEQFTPKARAEETFDSLIREPDDLDIDGPTHIGTGGGSGGGTGGGGTGGGGTGGGGTGGGGPVKQPPVIDGPPPVNQISEMINRVLSSVGMSRSGNSQPVMIFTPGQPQDSGGGTSMRSVVLLILALGVGYFLYKRFA